MSPPVALGALRLPGAVLAAAGAFGFGAAAVAGASESAGGGAPPAASAAPPVAAVTAGITWRSHGGRPPRLLETPAGAVYLPGSAGLGVDRALSRYARLWAVRAAPLLVSVRGGASAEYALVAAELEGVPGVAGLELDATAPDGASGAPFGHDPVALRRLLAEVRRTCDLPLLVKLPADLPDAEGALRAAAAGGAVAATLCGGLAAVAAPDGDEAPAPGWLVGPATFPAVLHLVTRLARDAPLPLIACGGVAAVEQARAYLRAGAAAVQVGSAHLADPQAAGSISAALT
jgi:dihydroorotate dehydrogenase (NAD+) catalytic subunit